MKRIAIFSLVICFFCRCQSYAEKSQDDSGSITASDSEKTVTQNDLLQIDYLERGFSNGGGFNLDLTTGNSPYDLSSPTNLHSKKDVKRLSFALTRPREIQQIYCYKDGLLIERYYSAHDVDPNETYEYDLFRRRTRSGYNFAYTYPENKSPDERERILYYRGKYHSTEIIRVIDNGYEIYAKRSDGSISSTKFIFNNRLLMHIIKASSMLGGEWDWYDFTYENGLLKEIVNATDTKDDIRSITRVLSYDGTNILELERQRIREGIVEMTERWKFLNYDEYGNWHDAECYSGEGVLTQKYHRDIEYN